MEVLIPCYKNSFISQYKTLRSCFIQTPHDPLIYVSILSLSDPGGALPAGDLGLVQNCGGGGGSTPGAFGRLMSSEEDGATLKMSWYIP